MDRHQAWIERIQAEIRELIAERTALIEELTDGREGLRVKQQAGQGALLRREVSGMQSNWLQVSDHAIEYHERAWHTERRWLCPRTPELILRIEALVGKVARLQAECKSLGRPWYDMAREALTTAESARSASVRSSPQEASPA
jgi:hypothetical protein